MPELTTEATTPAESLRRTVAIIEQLQLPADVGVQLDAGFGSIPPSVSLFPGSHANHREIRRRLGLHEWEREPQWAWAKVQVAGVDVVLHDFRGVRA